MALGGLLSVVDQLDPVQAVAGFLHLKWRCVIKGVFRPSGIG